jgi:4-diphosphocytidyl-2-C-methyl-D-erythritol kinase
VRQKRPDGRHELETVFAFCTDGDLLHAEPADGLSLDVTGPFAAALSREEDNLVIRAAEALAAKAGVSALAALTLVKNLPVASGIGGGSADAAAALRLLTRLWGIDPAHATAVAPTLGADVPACLLSMTARGGGVGDELQLVDNEGIAGSPALLVNPLIPLSTGAVFAAWDRIDRGPLGDWRTGRNDLEGSARGIAPVIGDVLQWLSGQPGASFVRMSGSGATCFALFDTEDERDRAAASVPADWWRLATFLR